MSNVYLQAVAPLKLPSTRKFVLMVLADMANDDGVSYASIANLIERTCLAERAVQMGLAYLEDLGILDRDFRRGRSTHYRLTDPTTWKALLPDLSPARRAPPHDVRPRTTCTDTPAPHAPAPAPHAPAPAPHAPITITQPSLNPKSEPKTLLASLALVPDNDETIESKPVKSKSTRTRTQPNRTGEPVGWAEFWDIYPRKTAKAAAQKAWRKLSPEAELREAIMRGLAAQLPALRTCEPRFRPHAATWLNGERWNDEPLETEPVQRTSDMAIDFDKVAYDQPMSKTMKGLLALEDLLDEYADEKGRVSSAPLEVRTTRSAPRAGHGVLPRDPRSEDEQIEAMIAGSIDPEGTRAMLDAARDEEKSQ